MRGDLGDSGKRPYLVPNLPYRRPMRFDEAAAAEEAFLKREQEPRVPGARAAAVEAGRGPREYRLQCLLTSEFRGGRYRDRTYGLLLSKGREGAGQRLGLVVGLVAAVRAFFGVVDQVELARRSALAGEKRRRLGSVLRPVINDM